MTEFHLLRPYWLLILIPVIGLLWMLAKHKKGSQRWRSVCDPELLPYILTSNEGRSSRIPIIVLAIVSLLVVLALAGPVWKKHQQPVFRTDSALVIILDLSLSMNAADIKPSRLSRAKHKIIDILRRRGEGQTALVVYALEAFTVSPLTQDTKTIELLVPSLSVDLMPSQGSQPDLAIDKAKELLQQAGATHGQVLLITDSASSDKLVNSVRQLVDSGHQLSVLGVGTSSGAPISLKEGGFLKDITGSIVISKLDTASLSLIAGVGGGQYQSTTSSDSDLNALMKVVNNEFKQGQLSQRESLDMQADLWEEEGPWLLLIVIPFVAMYFRRGWLLVLLLVCIPLPQISYAMTWDDLWSTPNQQAQKYFNAGEHDKALQKFEDEQWQAASYFRQKNYERALEKLSNVNTSDGQYNRGNALAKLGKLPEALASYEEAIKLDPKNEDAIYNRDLLKKYLEKQQEEKKQEQQQDQSQDQKQDQDQKQEQSKGDKQKDQNENQQGQEGQDGQKGDEQQAEEQNDDSKSADASENQKNEEMKGKEQQQADEKSQEMEKQKSQQAQAKDEEKENQNNDSDQTVAQQTQQTDEPITDEKQRAIEQWLRRVPDDPGGLLRRKFRYQSQTRGGQIKGTKPW